eukprot:TRINITY_DN60538_c0_g1_i1.p1 TRINITY_DN60538_c0_g1~~TRINITY_DN60538_c0_g1_i1.p1  ORF type:complete len:822 (+),score=209.81 TRINITY_DN60538_c0_g1_i1:75-2468(+)
MLLRAAAGALVLLAPAVRARCAGPGARLPCGRAGNGVQPDEPPSPDRCRARGCCVDADTGDCFMHWVGDAPNVTTVHVIQANHFDAGYTLGIVDVLNEYFATYIPRAVSVGAALRAEGGDARLSWLTQSYIVSLYLDCPPGLGLKCPTADEVAKFKTAVAAGDITWHAFPHNAEMMMLDEPLLRFGIEMTHDLDDKLGVPRKTAISLRDVPGYERSVIPILRAANVTMLSEGMNGRIYPPNVPPAFVWRDRSAQSPSGGPSPKGSPYGPVRPASGEDILAIWHPRGYGPLGDFVTVPGFAHALAYDWRGDNQGPPTSTKEVKEAFAKVQTAFPGAKVIASTLDAFAAELDKVRDSLPVITEEVGDSWIWGVGSDPIKTQRLRAVGRQRAACAAAGSCTGQDKDVYNMSRLLVKGSEHTWGIAYGTFGSRLRTGWSNAEFHKDRASGASFVKKFEQEWRDQMRFAVDAPVEALSGAAPGSAGAELRGMVASEFRDLAPAAPDLTGFTKAASPGAVLSGLGGWCDFGVDPASGAVTTLVDRVTGEAWASSSSPLALQRYQTLTETDYAAWRKEYLAQDCDWEYGKPGQDSGKGWASKHQLLPPAASELWFRNSSGTAEAIVYLQFPSDLNTLYGAPAAAWTHFVFRPASTDADRGVDITVTYLNKTTTRLGEAMFVTMRPPASNQSEWAMDKLGRWVSPLELVDGAPKGLHGITTGVRHTRPGGHSAFFASPDAAMVAWGSPTPFPTPLHTQPDLGEGASFVLWNNIWNTNYIFWWPYDTPSDKQTADIVFRFGISFLP